MWIYLYVHIYLRYLLWFHVQIDGYCVALSYSMILCWIWCDYFVECYLTWWSRIRAMMSLWWFAIYFEAFVQVPVSELFALNKWWFGLVVLNAMGKCGRFAPKVYQIHCRDKSNIKPSTIVQRPNDVFCWSWIWWSKTTQLRWGCFLST